jgi:hypothetical protein
VAGGDVLKSCHDLRRVSQLLLQLLGGGTGCWLPDDRDLGRFEGHHHGDDQLALEAAAIWAAVSAWLV